MIDSKIPSLPPIHRRIGTLAPYSLMYNKLYKCTGLNGTTFNCGYELNGLN